MGTIDFQGINDAALARYPALLEQWAPGGRVMGGEYKATNPTRSDSKPGSFAINVNSGKWGDFATGAQGGDPVSLFAYLNGLEHEQGEAAKKLSDYLGHGGGVDYAKNSTPAKKKTAPEWVQLFPVPDDAPAPPKEHPRHGTPSKVWTYRDTQKQVIGYIARFDLDDGSKEILPLAYFQQPGTNGGVWKWKSFDDKRPMYGLDRLAAMPEVNVVIVEGEKCAEALQRILLDTAAVVCWPGGGNAVGKVDWSPLHGRRCIFWPDFDAKKYKENHAKAGQLMTWAEQPGPKAMLKIIEAVREQIPVARIVPHQPGAHPDGWDCADAAEDGWSSELFLEFIKNNNVDALAPITAPEPPQDTENIPPEPDENPADFDPSEYIDETETETALAGLKHRFLLLGYDHGGYFFLSKGSRQVVELTAPEMSKSNLRRLAPDQDWQKTFRGKHGPDWDAAQVALIQLSHRAGIYSPKRIRGCGAWEDAGRSVQHLGDHLVVNGKKTSIEDHDSHFIYEASAPMNTGGTVPPAPASEAVKLLNLCKMLSWEKPINATLLAGWCVVAAICGALEWRPHIWTTGPAGSGKTWVVENILALMVGPIALQVQSNTTEAGLRQALKYDARPVIFDEAEGEDKSARNRIQNVLELMRQASTETGAEIIKGSTNGRAMTFRIRSCFAFSSIGVNLTQHADASRVTVLSLVKNTSPTAAEEFKAIQRYWADEMTPDFCRALRARAVNLIPVIRKNAGTFSRAAAEHLGNQRAGDQIGALLAGAYSLHSAKEITLEAAREWVKGQDWGDVVAEDEGQDETRCLSHILEHTLRVTGDRATVDLSVAELVEIVMYDIGKSGIEKRPADDTLTRFGIVVDPLGGTMTVSNTRSGVAAALKDTPWPKNWGLILSRVSGAEKLGPTRFGPGQSTRAVSIPLSCLSC